MNKCLSCGKDVKNKYCNVSCQNTHQNSSRANKNFGEFKSFIITCHKCEKEFEVIEREKLHPQKEKYYCSRSCANSHIRTEESKRKVSESLLRGLKIITICKKCGKDIEHLKSREQMYCSIDCAKEAKFVGIRIITECKNCGKEINDLKSKNRSFCSTSCNTIYQNKNTDRCKKGGLKSCKVQKEIRRSKNEIYLSELCMDYFNNVLINEQMFNGWDADIILNDQKIAILWNGKWHYKKIKKEHSVEQVQNRDRIKIKEIEKLGYVPYIIKDMGKFNKEFVENEFEKLKIIYGGVAD